MPYISFFGPDPLRPLNVGYLQWQLLSQETLVFTPARTSFAVDTGVRLHLPSGYYGDLDVRVPGDPLGRVRAYRIFPEDSGRRIEFRMQSIDEVRERGETRKLRSEYYTMPPLRVSGDGRVLVCRGDAIATLKVRRCNVPYCDHATCGN